MTHPKSETASPDSDLIARFCAIVGERNAITDPADQAPYLREWRDRYHGVTPVVLKPANVSEVAEILKLANAHRVGIVTQAGNTGLVGGQIPRVTGSDIVLSVERLNALRAIDRDGQHMTVEAGVVLANAQQFAEQAGLMFPLSIASEGSACVGGAVATNAGGVHVIGYGTMRQLTLGIEAVLANGDVWNGLRTLKKDNTGYDLKDLMVGSEGTLGVITAAVLRLVPPPASVATAMLGLQTLEAVADLFRHLSDRAGPHLTAFEFMSAQALDFVTAHRPDARAPFETWYPWTVLLDISSGTDDQDASTRLHELLTSDCALSHIHASAVAQSNTQAQQFWQLREAISEAQKIGGGSIKHDISVPIEHLPAFIDQANTLVTRLCPGARPCPFGHYGDGNIHYNVSQPDGGDTSAFLARWDEVQSAVHHLVLKFDGSISAEHGIGVMKRDALRRTKTAVELGMMREIKTALDPNGILNPGKVF